MNSRLSSNIKAALLTTLAFAVSSLGSVQADNEDNYGLWTSFDATKKINSKFKVGTELEFRTNDYLNDIDRFSIGFNLQYKINNWWKATAGHIFILGYNGSEKKTHFNDENNPPEEDGYNYEHSYWDKRNRVYIAISGETKIGRVKISLRERLQYTRTHAEIIDEDKHRFSMVGTEWDDEAQDFVDKTVWNAPVREQETKKHKNNTVLRSRLSAKWDIKDCKVSPFISTELYTRIDKWRGFEKLRSRIGASYKINKDNSFEIYYLFEKGGKKGSSNTHAIGVGYSIDL